MVAFFRKLEKVLRTGSNLGRSDRRSDSLFWRMSVTGCVNI